MLTKFQNLCSLLFDAAGRANRFVCEKETRFNRRFGMDDSKATQADLDAIVAGYQEEFKTNPQAQQAARWLGV